MIARAELFIASMRRSTRRATNKAPSAASAAKKISEIAIAWTITRADARAIAEVVPDQQAEAAGQREDARQRAPPRRRFVGGLVRRVDDAGLVEHAGRQLRDVAGERLAGDVGQQIERRARAGASASSMTWPSRRTPPASYCSARPLASASIVCRVSSSTSLITCQATTPSTRADADGAEAEEWPASAGTPWCGRA